MIVGDTGYQRLWLETLIYVEIEQLADKHFATRDRNRISWIPVLDAGPGGVVASAGSSDSEGLQALQVNNIAAAASSQYICHVSHGLSQENRDFTHSNLHLIDEVVAREKEGKKVLSDLLR